MNKKKTVSELTKKTVKNIVALRFKKQLSKREFALKSKVSEATLQNLENFRNSPTIETLERYANSLDTEVEITFKEK